MSTSQEAILLKIAADVSGLTKGLRQGRKEVGTFQEGLSSLKGELIGLAAVAGAGIGLAALAADALQFADSVQKVHDQTGLAVETIQFLRIAADQTGGSVDGLASMVSKMQRQLVEAGSNKDLQQNFRDMGLEISALRGMSPDAQFKAIADAIAAIRDPGEQATAAVAAFGKAGADAIPQLEAIAAKSGEIEAAMQRIGGPVSAEAIAKVDALGDSASLTKTAFTSMATELLGTVAPSLITFLETVQQVVAGLRLLDGEGDNALVNLDNKIRETQEHLDYMRKTNPFPDEFMQSQITAQEQVLKGLRNEYDAIVGLGNAGAERARKDTELRALYKANLDAGMADLLASLETEEGQRDVFRELRFEKDTALEDRLIAMRIQKQQEGFEASMEERRAENAFVEGLTADSNDIIQQMGQDLSDVKIETWQQETQGIAKLLEQQTAGVAQHSKAMFEINKAAGIVTTTIDTIQAVVKAWKDYGWPVGAVVGAAIAAAGAAQVAAISSTKFGSKTAPSQAATPPVPTAPQGGGGGGGESSTMRVEGVGADTLLTGKMVRTLADKLSDHVRDGGRVVWAEG
jgi:hypothetical protein